MNLFINEKSLVGQYNKLNVEQGIKIFLSSLIDLSDPMNHYTLFRSSSFFHHELIAGRNLNSTLKCYPDLEQKFLLNIKSATLWQAQQLHENSDQYYCQSESVSGSSVAELAARKLGNYKLKGLLLNFTNSSFSNRNTVPIIKNGKEQVDVDCSDNSKVLKAWLRKNNIKNPYGPYDEKSSCAPYDEQTILATDDFEISPYKNRGRRAYRLKGTHQLWCVDASERHIIGIPHLEIFDENTGRHLGTSLYDRICLDLSFIKNRHINLSKTYPIF